MKNISKDAKNLIKNLINKTVEKRFSSEQALNHNWFKIMSEKIQEKNKNIKAVVLGFNDTAILYQNDNIEY